MTCGAAASLTITLGALREDGDEFVLLAPFFPEYSVFVKAAGGTPVVVPFDEKTFAPDLAALEKAINPHTKGIIVNSPNNPSGTVYSRATLERIAALLSAKSAEYGTHIALIADEPYRELVYDDIEVPYLMNLYPDTIVCYSFSKSLSLPGERIGYIAVSPRMTEGEGVYAAVCGAGRALGYVCAPSMFQRIIAACTARAPTLKPTAKTVTSFTAHSRKWASNACTPTAHSISLSNPPNPTPTPLRTAPKTSGCSSSPATASAPPAMCASLTASATI